MPPAILQSTPTKPPPLENGDRLNSVEFERRYAAMPENVKAELIDGVVYMASPVSQRKHGRPHHWFNGFLYCFEVATPGTEGGDNSSLRMDSSNQPQPDGLLRIHQAAGGRSTIDADGYLIGSPELLAEIAASSVSYDLGPKLGIYRRLGVQEYVVWRVQDREIDWFVLRNGDYVRMQPDANGIVKSEVFPGLWLHVESMLKGDIAAVQRTLQQGLASVEHQQFVAQLAAALTPTPLPRGERGRG